MSKFNIGDYVKVVSTDNTEEEFGYTDSMLDIYDYGFIEDIIRDCNIIKGFNYHEDDLELAIPTIEEELKQDATDTCKGIIPNPYEYCEPKQCASLDYEAEYKRLVVELSTKELIIEALLSYIKELKK